MIEFSSKTIRSNDSNNSKRINNSGSNNLSKRRDDHITRASLQKEAKESRTINSRVKILNLVQCCSLSRCSDKHILKIEVKFLGVVTTFLKPLRPVPLHLLAII